MQDPSSVLVDGAWSHRDVRAGGYRFHIAEAGSGPLVVLLHGFPEFWWGWRHQLVGLAAGGMRAVAPDLRGYGASDKPPRGYDLPTLADDVAGLITGLGERDAVVVGHGWGGLIAWTVAALHPDVVRRLVVISAPHPLRLRKALRGSGGQLAALGHAMAFQLPWRPERHLVADDGAYVGELLHAWAGPGWPDEESEHRYRAAMQIPGVAHCSLEYYRWAVRSLVRPDGVRYAHRMRAAITAPTLQLHGTCDTCVLPEVAQGSGSFVTAAYEWHDVPDVGHFPHVEVPGLVTTELMRWCALS
ncbi:MAG: alpha/beta fold hydrolase [Actinomycetes bacterium]